MNEAELHGLHFPSGAWEREKRNIAENCFNSFPFCEYAKRFTGHYTGDR